jgi:hypothetical protein
MSSSTEYSRSLEDELFFLRSTRPLLKDTAQFYFRWPRAPVPQAFKFRTQWRHPPEALGRSFNPCRFRRRFQGCSTPRAFCLRPLRPSLPRLPRRNLSTSRALRTNGRLPPGWRAATLSVTQQAASGLPSSSFRHSSSSSSSSSSSFNPMLSRRLLLLSRFVRGLRRPRRPRRRPPSCRPPSPPPLRLR